jgi:hypothetical protein
MRTFITTTVLSGYLKLTGKDACFDLVAFLRAHADVLGISDSQTQDVSDALRMTRTSDFLFIADMTYLEDLTFLDIRQKKALFRLAQEVQKEPAYLREHDTNEAEIRTGCVDWLAREQDRRRAQQAAAEKIAGWRLNQRLGCLLGGEARGGIHDAYARRDEHFDAEEDAEDALDAEEARAQARAREAARAERERKVAEWKEDVRCVTELTVKIRRGADIGKHPELRKMLELLEEPLLALYDALTLGPGATLEGRPEVAYDMVVSMVHPFKSLQSRGQYTGDIVETMHQIVHVLVVLGRELYFPENLQLVTENEWYQNLSLILNDLEYGDGDGMVADWCGHFRSAFDIFYGTHDYVRAQRAFKKVQATLASLDVLVFEGAVGHADKDVKTLRVIVACYGREYAC